LDTGKTSEAEANVKEILGKNSKDLMGRYFDARIRLIKGNSDVAISLLQDIIKDEPQFAFGHHLLGIAYVQKGETAQARDAFREAIRLNPNLPESRTALAQLYLLEGSADLAIEQAHAAVQLNPRNVAAAIISGDAYLLKGDFAKGRQVFEAVSRGLPKEAIGPYRLGLIDRAEKHNEKALSHFEEALSRKPTAIEPLAQIAIVKIGQGKSNEARDRVTNQIEAHPNNPLLYNLLGQLWMTAKNNGKAEIAFKKAIELDNSLLSAYVNLAQLYFQAGNTDQAEHEYQTVIGKDPTVIPAHMVLGIIHELRKDADKARTHYEQALKLNPKFAPAANNLAWLQAEQGGNLDIALSYAQTAREQRPDDPHIADTLGWIYYKRNSFLLATNLLKEAVEKLADEPLIHYHYGMAQYKNGDARGAKKSLETALKFNQHFSGSDEAKKTLAGL
jgi:tetratricopeptide (TPR) repeat protein